MIKFKLINPNLVEGVIMIYSPHYREFNFQAAKAAGSWILSINGEFALNCKTMDEVFNFLCDSKQEG